MAVIRKLLRTFTWVLTTACWPNADVLPLIPVKSGPLLSLLVIVHNSLNYTYLLYIPIRRAFTVCITQSKEFQQKKQILQKQEIPSYRPAFSSVTPIAEPISLYPLGFTRCPDKGHTALKWLCFEFKRQQNEQRDLCLSRLERKFPEKNPAKSRQKTLSS